MPDVYAKDPNEVLDYKFDWTSRLAVSETISTSVMTAPAGITKDSESNTTTDATVWLSGGSAGGIYRVSNRITTNQSRTMQRSIIIRVEVQ